MTSFIGHPVRITEWTGRALKSLDDWGRSEFDWPEIMRRDNDPDRLDMAIWSGQERLAALGLAVTTGQAVILRFLEGDPRQDCPLKGRRILIALETAANYAQAQGKKEIRLQPVNDKLVDLYEKVYGFKLESPRNETPYYRKGV